MKYVILWHILYMPKHPLKTRLERLDWLESRLKADSPMIMADIAAELGMSMRTLHRDIGLLRARGLPIETEQGRGGGIRLHPNWGVGRIALTPQEALNLLISLAVTEKMGTSMMLSSVTPIQRKLIASFSSASQRTIVNLRERLRVGPPASAQTIAAFSTPDASITQSLQYAFLHLETIEIDYVDQSLRKSSRHVDIHYLVLNYPIWYALCWDHLRQDIRTFRFDRVQSVAPDTGSSFPLRPFPDFHQTMIENDLMMP